MFTTGMPIHMVGGVVAAIGAGLFFATGAALFAATARRGLPFLPFLPFLSTGALLACAISLAAFVNWSSIANAARLDQLAGWIAAGALVNLAGHFAMARSMKTGRSAISWAIGQGGQMLSFIAAVAIWSETAGVAGLLGITLTAIGVIILAGIQRRQASDSEVYSGRWIGWALFAMCCYGLNQTLMSVPSHWENWADTARLRVPITCAVIAATGFIIRPPSRENIPRLLPWAFAYGLVTIGSFALIYRALDLLSAGGRSAIVWPVACSTGVTGYSLWEHIIHRKRTSAAELAGLTSIVGGIFALAVRVSTR